jgi:hypothetical protein
VLKITAKGRRVYAEIQAAFGDRLRQKLAAAPVKEKSLSTTLKQVVKFSQLLRGQLETGGSSLAAYEEGADQLPLLGL